MRSRRTTGKLAPRTSTPAKFTRSRTASRRFGVALSVDRRAGRNPARWRPVAVARRPNRAHHGRCGISGTRLSWRPRVVVAGRPLSPFRRAGGVGGGSSQVACRHETDEPDDDLGGVHLLRCLGLLSDSHALARERVPGRRREYPLRGATSELVETVGWRSDDRRGRWISRSPTGSQSGDLQQPEGVGLEHVGAGPFVGAGADLAGGPLVGAEQVRDARR